MDRKILFLDLDGTLLNSSREVSPGNRAALEQALSLGHKVVINTGRPLHSAIIQNDRLGFHQDGCYVVSFNGGMIYDAYREKLVYSHCLPLDTAKAILTLCNSRNIHVQTYDREYCGRILMHYRVLPSFETGLQQDPPKVLAVSEEDRPALERLRQELLQRFEDVDCFFSSKQLLEIVPKGVHKGSALERLCRLLDIPVANSVAAGDEENDITMLRAAGVGCAMRNAVEAVKEAADYVTVHNNDEDGIAEIVEKFLL